MEESPKSEILAPPPEFAAPQVTPPKESLWRKKLHFWQWFTVFTSFSLLLASCIGFWWTNKFSGSLSEPGVTLWRPARVEAMFLEVTSPADGLITGIGDLVVSGRTLPGVPVLFFTENSENSVDSGPDGTFSAPLQVQPGMNTLTVTAVGEDGTEATRFLDVAMDDAVLGKNTEKDNPSVDKNAPRKDNGRVLVGEVQEVKPGKVTVKDSGKKNPDAASIDASTIILNSKNKPLKITGVKLNDKTLVLLAENGTATGAARKAIKVYVRTASESATLASKRQAIHGIVTGISGPVVTIAHQIQRDRIYTFSVFDTTVIKIKGIEAASLAQVPVGSRVSAVMDRDAGGGWVAKWLHVIPGKATGIFNRFPVSPLPRIPACHRLRFTLLYPLRHPYPHAYSPRYPFRHTHSNLYSHPHSGNLDSLHKR